MPLFLARQNVKDGNAMRHGAMFRTRSQAKPEFHDLQQVALGIATEPESSSQVGAVEDE
jgi:hypothetical protein